MSSAAAYDGKMINLSFPRPRVLLVSLNRAPVNAFSEPLCESGGSRVLTSL